MKGVFETGDCLFVKKTKFKNLKKGDIVVFINKAENSKKIQIVHRVIKITGNKLTTRGDSNRREDTHPVTSENLIGEVISFERDGKKYKVRGGFLGLYQAKIKYFIRRSIFWLYKNITNISFFRSLGRILLVKLARSIKKIKLNSMDGSIIKWVLNGKVIAKKGPDSNDFYVKKPFDLIIK